MQIVESRNHLRTWIRVTLWWLAAIAAVAGYFYLLSYVLSFLSPEQDSLGVTVILLWILVPFGIWGTWFQSRELARKQDKEEKKLKDKLAY